MKYHTIWFMWHYSLLNRAYFVTLRKLYICISKKTKKAK
jgi:hypothetical protein